MLGTHLTEIHDDALVNLLPQVSPEDLNEGDLQRGDLAVHKDSCQVKLYLETHVHLETRQKNKSQSRTFTASRRAHLESDNCTNVGSVDGGGPPQSEATIRDLVQTRPLGVRQLLPFHRLFKAASLFPKAKINRL